MMKNKMLNLGIIKKVSKALGELNSQVAFVGGATVSLYANDPNADDVRPTIDVDIVVHIASFGELTALQEKLGQRNIYVDPNAHITCRFTYENVIIDVMATKQVGWAPSNEWFEPGFKNLIPFKLDEETTIQIFPISYFLATKFSAYAGRGVDPRTSKDFEDIIYILDNRLGIVDEILTAPEDVRSFLAFQLHELQHAGNQEAIQAHLNPYSARERFNMIQEKIKQVIKGL
jgi:predicted nucleotidyltransferase